MKKRLIVFSAISIVILLLLFLIGFLVFKEVAELKEQNDTYYSAIEKYEILESTDDGKELNKFIQSNNKEISHDCIIFTSSLLISATALSFIIVGMIKIIKNPNYLQEQQALKSVQEQKRKEAEKERLEKMKQEVEDKINKL
jgi:uncharacterized protein YxeA